MRGSVPSAVVKLGGSVITDKAGGSLTVDSTLVARIAAELAQHRPDRLVIVHGAGSFGHRIVMESGIHQGLADAASRLAMGETQRLQYELDAIVTRSLLEAGLPAMPVQASAAAVLSGGELVHFDTTVVRVLLDQGLVPVLYGVPAVDRERGCAILSGDVIAPFVAHAVGLEWMVHATDVDGIFTADPRTDPSAVRISHVHRRNFAEVRACLTGSTSVDVTGGMARKVAELMAWAERGLRSRIVDARIPDRVAAALRGEDVGTLVDGTG
ncbi:MAG: isopentenyl phosphate kinase family protein [Polyangiaceae bacterium]|nr:isopentenyl phosphate kinase family protein [Polyangiaceae bacterium]